MSEDPTRTVTSKEAHRNWKLVTDKALRAPVVITAHGRPRHVLMAYEDYARLRAGSRQAYRADTLPPDLGQDILSGMAERAAPRDPAPRTELDQRLPAIQALCRRHGVARLEVFGSAARGADFDAERSDYDFLVTFMPAARNDMAAFEAFQSALEALLGRPVDLVEREAIEASRNFIRRRRILAEAETIYG